MNIRLLFSAVLAVAAFPSIATAQAATETVLTNSGSATTTIGAGSRLGGGLKRNMDRLSDRIQQQAPASSQKAPQSVPKPNQRSTTAPVLPAQAPATTSSQPPAQGPLVLSIEGAAKCLPADQKNPGPCRSRSSSAASDANAYKSVINISTSQ